MNNSSLKDALLKHEKETATLAVYEATIAFIEGLDEIKEKTKDRFGYTLYFFDEYAQINTTLSTGLAKSIDGELEPVNLSISVVSPRINGDSSLPCDKAIISLSHNRNFMPERPHETTTDAEITAALNTIRKRARTLGLLPK